MSLFTDKRADESEIPAPELRGGWIGNEQKQIADFEIGSKLWLSYQSRLTQDTLNDVIGYVQDSLSWMITSSIIKNILVDGTVVDNQGIIIDITFQRFDDTSFGMQFDLWENTEIV